MRTKVLLAAVILATGLCFVPALGYGEDEPDRATETMDIVSKLEEQGVDVITNMRIILLQDTLDYIMAHPHNFLSVYLEWDYMGWYDLKRDLPEGVQTEGKIIVEVTDNRGVFWGISEVALLEQFQKELKRIHYYIGRAAPKMDRDVVALFYSSDRTPLGYFYRGEYHLWPD